MVPFCLFRDDPWIRDRLESTKVSVCIFVLRDEMSLVDLTMIGIYLNKLGYIIIIITKKEGLQDI